MLLWQQDPTACINPQTVTSAWHVMCHDVTKSAENLRENCLTSLTRRIHLRRAPLEHSAPVVPLGEAPLLAPAEGARLVQLKSSRLGLGRIAGYYRFKLLLKFPKIVRLYSHPLKSSSFKINILTSPNTLGSKGLRSCKLGKETSSPLSLKVQLLKETQSMPSLRNLHIWRTCCFQHVQSNLVEPPQLIPQKTQEIQGFAYSTYFGRLWTLPLETWPMPGGSGGGRGMGGATKGSSQFVSNICPSWRKLKMNGCFSCRCQPAFDFLWLTVWRNTLRMVNAGQKCAGIRRDEAGGILQFMSSAHLNCIRVLSATLADENAETLSSSSGSKRISCPGLPRQGKKKKHFERIRKALQRAHSKGATELCQAAHATCPIVGRRPRQQSTLDRSRRPCEAERVAEHSLLCSQLWPNRHGPLINPKTSHTEACRIHFRISKEIMLKLKAQIQHCFSLVQGGGLVAKHLKHRISTGSTPMVFQTDQSWEWN